MHDVSEFPEVPAPSSASAVALQSREVADLQTQYLMAERFPRNERLAVDRITNAFSRPGLAERAAYEYTKGGEAINGPSIRAAEALAQHWGNIDFGFREYGRSVGVDGVPFSEVEAYAHDLQARSRRRISFQVRHWRDTKRGGYRLKDDRDVYELVANQAQRRVRACILSLVPGDVIDAAMDAAALALKARADTTPEGLAKLVEAFAPYGVTREHVEGFIGRRLDSIAPGQVVRLKRIWASLRDEMSVPGDWFAMGDPNEPPAPPPPASVEAVRETIRRKREPAPPPPPAAPPAGEPTKEQADAIRNAPDVEAAALLLDAARGEVEPAVYERLTSIYRDRWVAE